MRRLASACAATALFAVSACSAGGTGGPPINSVNPSSPSYGTLQFAVGTANIYGSAQPGLNVVSTFRQTNGASATGVNTPTVTGPFTFPGGVAEAVSTGGSGDPYSTILAPGNSVPGPGLSEVTGSRRIAGTPQTVKPGTPNCDGTVVPAGFIACLGGIAPNTTTFGQSGGVFAMGIAPYNNVAATEQSYSYQPYAQPFFAANALPPAGHTAFIPWGGPPAFDANGDGMGERDGLSINGVDSFNNPYFLGVAEGITAFDGVHVEAGAYTLSVAIATVGNGGAITISTLRTSAQLHSTAMLPTLTAPVVKPDGNGDGGATFSTSLPSGVTDAYVQIVDYGPGGGPNDGAASNPSNCQGARGTPFAPVYYTMHVTRSKAFYVLPPTIGPNLSNSGGVNGPKQPSPTLCTAAQNTAATGAATPADDYVVQIIGFNYPIYQAALGLTQATTPEKPQITGPSGQSDITLSVPMEQDQGSLTPVPASARRAIRPAARTRR